MDAEDVVCENEAGRPPGEGVDARRRARRRPRLAGERVGDSDYRIPVGRAERRPRLEGGGDVAAGAVEEDGPVAGPGPGEPVRQDTVERGREEIEVGGRPRRDLADAEDEIQAVRARLGLVETRR